MLLVVETLALPLVPLRSWIALTAGNLPGAALGEQLINLMSDCLVN